MSHEFMTSRRRFLGMAGVTFATAATALMPSKARAQDLPHVTGGDPTARALGYVEDAGKSTDAKRKAGQTCASCQFYTGAPSGFAPCALFPGKAVSAKGWCVSYASKKG